MIFADIPAGISIFVDANVLVYHFAPDPVLNAPCGDLLVRIKKKEITAFTSTHVLSEVAHRLMTIEAIKTLGWPIAGIAQRLQKHPADVQRLTGFRKAIEEVPNFGINVIPIAAHLPAAGCAISQQTGLLSNDALIVAVMQANGLAALASHDTDFDRVAALTRYAPV